KTGEIPLSAATLDGFGSPNSVAVKNGVVAVAYGNADPTLPGYVALFSTSTLAQIGNEIQVGVLPEMVTFTPDGTRILVANEAEPASASNNAAGTISIIDVASGAVVSTIGFGALDTHEAQLESLGLALLGQGQASAINVPAAQLTASKDIEPEY